MTVWDEEVGACEQVVGADCTLDKAAMRILAALDTGCLMVYRLAWIEEAAAIIRQQLKALGLRVLPPDDNHHAENGDALLWLALRLVALTGQFPKDADVDLPAAERTLRVWWARQQPGIEAQR